MNKDLENLMAYLFHSQTQVHIYHLQTKSYSEHKALQKYYEGVNALIDGIIESYQGKNNIISSYKNFALDSYKSGDTIIAYLKALAKKVEDVYGSTKDTYIQNQLDGVTELINSTIYKLKFLK